MSKEHSYYSAKFSTTKGVFEVKAGCVQSIKSYGAGNEVPYEILEEAHKEYGSDQTLKRIQERGGFGWHELVILLYARLKRTQRELAEAKSCSEVIP